MGERRCKECHRPVPPGAEFCSNACRMAYANGAHAEAIQKGRDKAKVRSKEERDKKAPRVNPWERARAKKSEQTKRTEAFYDATREWYWKEVRAFEAHWTALGVPGLTEPGSTACGMMGMHRCGGGLSFDHVGTRNDKDPANLQTLCAYAQGAKGSSKGSKWDFRTDAFRDWLIKARDRDWVYNALHQRWEKRS